MENENVVLNLRQLALLKQKLVDLRKDVERMPSRDMDQVEREKRDLYEKLGKVIDSIHTLAGSDTLWLETFEEADRVRLENLKKGK